MIPGKYQNSVMCYHNIKLIEFGLEPLLIHSQSQSTIFQSCSDEAIATSW